MCPHAGPLEAGHIVPAFVYRWLKETGATPFFRDGENPNLRLQDGYKRRWFCRACEDQMGRFERAFAEDLFPSVVGQQTAPYRHGPWLSRFLASVALRTVMLYSEEHDAFHYFTDEQTALIPRALKHWRAFVHGEADTPGIHELHFLPMGTLGDGTTLHRPLPPNINFYTLRTIEIHVASNSALAFAFVKMGPAVSLGFIQPPAPGSWVGTKVALGEGQVGGQMALPRDFFDYFIERAERVRQANRRRSARQNDKIRDSIAANMERATASGTFQALDADVKRFGADRVFSWEDEEPSSGTRA